jgi:hypothetical protein
MQVAYLELPALIKTASSPAVALLNRCIDE